MREFILDTHTLLWMQDNNPSLSTNTLKILTNTNNNLFISIASFWEISIKQSLGKLELSYSLDELHSACLASGIRILPIGINELNILIRLPFNHRDPFDRLIISTAMSLKYAVISKDEYFKKYEVDLIW